MTTFAVVVTLYSYFLGGVWEIGPFTDLKSCEMWRTYQITNGINDVSLCRPVMNPATWGAPLTVDEYARRVSE